MSTAEMIETPEIAFTDTGEPYEVAGGEILDPSDPRVAAYLESIDAAAPPIAGREDVEAALERLADIEGRIGALEARREMYVRNLNAQIGREQRKLAWWEWRNRAPIVEFAKRELVGKERTAHFDHGRIKFRTSPGKTDIIDMDAAVEWVERFEPSEVKIVSTVSVTAIKKAMATAEREGVEVGKLPFIATEGPRESIKIETGIAGKD